MLASQIPDMRNRGVKEASYVVLTGTSMPAILAEVSFVSSPADEAKLEEFKLSPEDRGRRCTKASRSTPPRPTA